MVNNCFVLDFPSGWRETTVHIYQGPDADGLQHNLMLAIKTAS